MEGHIASRKIPSLSAKLSLIIFSAAAFASASNLLVSQTRDQEGLGYNQLFWTNMTADLNTAAANNVTAVADLSDLSQMLSYDGIWVDLREFQTGSMTAVESSNLTAYLATGRHVVFIGENAANFASWNSAILNLFGATTTSIPYSGATRTASFVPLTDGVGYVTVSAGAVTTTGTSLFSDRVATMWGPAHNALVLLDSDTFSDDSLKKTDNSRFANNVAAWVTGNLSDAGHLWQNPAGGNWTDPAAWLVGFMPGNGDDVTFNLSSDATLAPAYTVTVPSALTAHSINVRSDRVTFDFPNLNSSLMAGGNLSIGQGAGNSGFLTLTTHSVGTPSIGNFSVGNVTVNAGSLTIGEGAAFTASGITTLAEGSLLSVSGSAAFANLTGHGNVIVQAGGKLSAAVIREASLTVNGSVMVSEQASPRNNPNTVCTLSRLIIAGSTDSWTGLFNLQNNDLIIYQGNFADITNQIKNGLRNGTGITSTTAGLTTLGIMQADGNGLFDGQPIVAGDVLVKYTYFGDADLNGIVDGNDYSLIDKSYAAHRASNNWNDGDFNYDGLVDGSDYTLIDNAFNLQTSSMSSMPTASITIVPEVTDFGLLAVIVVLLSRRRQCKAMSNPTPGSEARRRPGLFTQ